LLYQPEERGEMLENSSRNRKLLAGVVGVNLALALAVSAGAMPHPGDSGPVRTATVSQIQEVAAPEVRQPGDVRAQPASQAAVAAAPGTASTVPTTAVTPKPTVAPATTAAPTTKAPVVKVAPAAAIAPVVNAPVVTAPPVPVKVARRTPTAAEVETSISELKRQVGGLLLLVSPTPAQLAQAGDQVCTAFDNGQNFTQVKATGLTLIPASITVSPATVDWAVRRGVALYCPGHAAKLV
jgi:hypothetical protein